jgi:hypothetical protein
LVGDLLPVTLARETSARETQAEQIPEQPFGKLAGRKAHAHCGRQENKVHFQSSDHIGAWARLEFHRMNRYTKDDLSLPKKGPAVYGFAPIRAELDFVNPSGRV